MSGRIAASSGENRSDERPIRSDELGVPPTVLGGVHPGRRDASCRELGVVCQDPAEAVSVPPCREAPTDDQPAAGNRLRPIHHVSRDQIVRRPTLVRPGQGLVMT